MERKKDKDNGGAVWVRLNLQYAPWKSELSPGLRTSSQAGALGS